MPTMSVGYRQAAGPVGRRSRRGRDGANIFDDIVPDLSRGMSRRTALMPGNTDAGSRDLLVDGHATRTAQIRRGVDSTGSLPVGRAEIADRRAFQVLALRWMGDAQAPGSIAPCLTAAEEDGLCHENEKRWKRYSDGGAQHRCFS